MRQFKPFLLLCLLLLSCAAWGSNELKATNTASTTVYAVILNAAGQAWNGTTFATYADGNWSTYAVLIPEKGTSAFYVGDFPAGIVTSGRYTIAYFQRAGGAAALSDTLVGQGLVDWDGAAVVTNAALNTTLNTVATNAATSATQSTTAATAATAANGKLLGNIAAQTGDSYARLGAPAGASLSADVASVFSRIGAPVGASLSADIAGIPAAVFGTTAATYNANGTFGAKINTAASAGSANDPFTNLTSTSYAGGTFGALLKTNLDAAISSRLAAGNVTVGGYASGQDPATLVMGYNVSSGLTVSQAIMSSMRNLKSYQGALDTNAHTRLVKYFIPGTSDGAAQAGTGTTLFTATVHYATDNATLLYTTYN